MEKIKGNRCCSACGKLVGTNGIECECSGSTYCSGDCQLAHYAAHARAHRATLSLQTELARMGTLARASQTCASVDSPVAFAALDAAELGMTEIRACEADRRDDARIEATLEELRACEFEAETGDVTVAPLVDELGVQRFPEEMVPRPTESRGRGEEVSWAAHSVASASHPNAICYWFVDLPQSALSVGFSARDAFDRFLGPLCAHASPPPDRSCAARVVAARNAVVVRTPPPRGDVSCPVPRAVLPSSYPWFRPMPHRCYWNPESCTLAFYERSYGNLRVPIVPYSYVEIFERISPPLDWQKVVEIAMELGMVAPAPGAELPRCVRWILPDYGIHPIDWIPPSFKMYFK